MESRPPGAGYISTAWDGEQITESDAEGSASIAVRQRPHASAEEQLNAVLGDGSGEAEAPFQVFAEVRGGYDLGHHRWVVLRFHVCAPEPENGVSGRQHLVSLRDPVRGT
jgi:hypothetical protein